MHRAYHEVKKKTTSRETTTQNRKKKHTEKNQRKREKYTQWSIQEQTENKKNQIDKYQGWKSIITIDKCLCLVNTILNKVIIWPTIRATSNANKTKSNHTKTNEFSNLTFEAFEQTVTTQNPSWLFGDKDIRYHGHRVMMHVHASVIRLYATM